MRFRRLKRPSVHHPEADERDLQAWLVHTIAGVLQVHPEEIDTRRSFADYGLDSLQLVSLSGDLEEHIARPLSETIAWDYPTIELLVRHLLEPDAVQAVPMNVDPEEDVEYEV
jgi:acyl carrier protein